MTMTHDNDHDHEVWVRCFTAAIAGAFSAGNMQRQAHPTNFIEWCGEIADGALEEERKRRRNPEHQAFIAGPPAR
jgi:hypothetical protein